MFYGNDYFLSTYATGIDTYFEQNMRDFANVYNLDSTFHRPKCKQVYTSPSAAIKTRVIPLRKTNMRSVGWHLRERR